MANADILSVLEHANRPMTTKELEFLMRDTKNSRSVFREIQALLKRKMLIRVEIKIPGSKEIVLYKKYRKNTV
jgi:hypothetical protein